MRFSVQWGWSLVSAQFDLIIGRIRYSGIKLVWSIIWMDPTKVARARGPKKSNFQGLSEELFLHNVSWKTPKYDWMALCRGPCLGKYSPERKNCGAGADRQFRYPGEATVAVSRQMCTH